MRSRSERERLGPTLPKRGLDFLPASTASKSWRCAQVQVSVHQAGCSQRTAIACACAILQRYRMLLELSFWCKHVRMTSTCATQDGLRLVACQLLLKRIPNSSPAHASSRMVFRRPLAKAPAQPVDVDDIAEVSLSVSVAPTDPMATSKPKRACRAPGDQQFICRTVGPDCRYAADGSGARARGKRSGRCIFCCSAKMAAALDTQGGRGNVVRMLKQWKRSSSEVFDAAFSTTVPWHPVRRFSVTSCGLPPRNQSEGDRP